MAVVVKSNYSRVIFCPNQVTVAVALGLTKRDGKVETTTIIYWPDRCDVSGLIAIGVSCIQYSRFACLLYLLRSLFGRGTEALLPHHKLGRSVNWVAKLCASTALIDDGLDTLRNAPRNVDPNLFEYGSIFYTFQYEIPLGIWLNRFIIDRVSSFSMMADVSRKTLDLTQVQRLIIESPPLDRIKWETLSGYKNCMLVTHSNINKRVIKSFTGLSILGSNIALEKSLDNFSGEVIVGESMVLVYALMLRKPKFKVTVYLGEENINNFNPLIKIIRFCEFAELKQC